MRTGPSVFSQSLAGSSAGRFFPAAPPAAAISSTFPCPSAFVPARVLREPRELHGKEFFFNLYKETFLENQPTGDPSTRVRNMAAPVVLVTGGSGLVGQGIRWQVQILGVNPKPCDRHPVTILGFVAALSPYHAFLVWSVPPPENVCLYRLRRTTTRQMAQPSSFYRQKMQTFETSSRLVLAFRR